MPPAEPAAKSYRPWIGLQLGHQIGHSLEFRSGRNNDYFILAREACNWCCHVERDRRLVGENGTEHHEAVHHQNIGFAFFLINKLGEPYRAASTWHIFNRAAFGTHASHDFRERTCRLVPAAAWFCRGDDPEIVKGQCRCGHAETASARAMASRLAKIVRLFMIFSHYSVLTI